MMIGSSCGKAAIIRSVNGPPERYRRTIEFYVLWHCLVRLPISGWRTLVGSPDHFGGRP